MSVCTILASCPSLTQTVSGVCYTQKGNRSANTFPVSELGGWKTPLYSINRPIQKNTRSHSNTLVTVGVKEIGLYLATEEEVDPVELSSKTGMLPKRRCSRNTTARQDARTSAVFKKKNKTHTQGIRFGGLWLVACHIYRGECFNVMQNKDI